MSKGMQVVSWNVNGVRARWPRLVELLTCERPDVVCLQETRCPDGRFPYERLWEMGVLRGIGWSPVALLQDLLLEAVILSGIASGLGRGQVGRRSLRCLLSQGHTMQ